MLNTNSQLRMNSYTTNTNVLIEDIDVNSCIVFTKPFIVHGTLNLVRFVFTEPLIAHGTLSEVLCGHNNIFSNLFAVNNRILRYGILRSCHVRRWPLIQIHLTPLGYFHSRPNVTSISGLIGWSRISGMSAGFQIKVYALLVDSSLNQVQLCPSKLQCSSNLTHWHKLFFINPNYNVGLRLSYLYPMTDPFCPIYQNSCQPKLHWRFRSNWIIEMMKWWCFRPAPQTESINTVLCGNSDVHFRLWHIYIMVSWIY